MRYDGESLTPFLGCRRENIVSFVEVDGKTRALGFVRQWTVRGDKVSMQPLDPKGELLLNNLNSPDLPPGYVLLEDRREQGRVLARLEEDGLEETHPLPLLDRMAADRKMYVDSTGIYVPTPEGLYVVEGNTIRLLTQKWDVFSLIRSREGLILESLLSVEQRLPRPPFARVDRSTIVNLPLVCRVNVAGQTCTIQHPDGRTREQALSGKGIKNLLELL